MKSKNTLLVRSEYPLMYKVEEKLWWYAGLRDLLKHYLKIVADKNIKILDAGCGTGKNMEFINSFGFQTYGIDLSEDAIYFCRKRKLKNLKTGSITKLTYKSSYFDVIISTDVIGSLGKKLSYNAVNEFFRVLKPEGLLIIQCAALEQLRSQHDDLANIRHRFTKKELIRLFDKSKWKVIKASYRIFFLFPFLAAIKYFKKLSKKAGEKSSTDLSVPPAILNYSFYLIQKMENRLFTRVNFPVGTSLFLVVKKLK